ncbi:hypothetical protein PFISCL1PPCAC_13542, partial [Pristionchus fissidentatus]
MLLPLTVSVERFLATKWWEWYERQSMSTLFAFLSCLSIIELGVITPSLCAVYEVYSLVTQMILFAAYLSIGVAIFLQLLSRNRAALMALKARRIRTRYTVSKHYQIKENLLVFAMLRKIAMPAAIGAVPPFLFFSLYLAVPSELCQILKLGSVALFDLY